MKNRALLLVLLAASSACSDVATNPQVVGSPVAQKPRKNGGWISECVGITFYGNTTPNLNNVPDGASVAWSYQDGYTYIQTCLPEALADWPTDVCSERSTDWMSVCQIQLPILGDPIPGGWALMPGSGGGQSAGNGGIYGGTLTDDELYCPTGSPGCLLPLRADAAHNDRAKMDSALAKVDQSRPICKMAYDAVKAISSKWYRGNPLIPDVPGKPEANDHDARSRTGSRPLLHVDESYLDSSTLKGLAELLLHEGWHLAGKAPHPREDAGPIYNTVPYNEAQSCVPN